MQKRNEGHQKDGTCMGESQRVEFSAGWISGQEREWEGKAEIARSDAVSVFFFIVFFRSDFRVACRMKNR